ncbi:hypothetical protein ABPG73_015942 [Tetrahymena malaccensis]
MGCTQAKQPKVKLSPEEIKELEACREAILQCMKASRNNQFYYSQPQRSQSRLNYLNTQSDCTLPTKNSLNSPKKQ